MDGTLTRKGPNTWATFDYPHLHQPECDWDQSVLDEFNGVICDNTAQLRRLAFYGASPSSLFRGMSMKVLKYDNDQLAAQGNVTAHLLDKTAWTEIIIKDSGSPSNSWTGVYVTGHRYRFHFGETGLNFENLEIEVSERWEPTDKEIQFFHNFSDVRVAINVTVDGVQVNNDTLKAPGSSLNQIGMNYVQNDTDKDGMKKHFPKSLTLTQGEDLYKDPMMISFVINAKSKPNKYHYHKLKFIGQRCWGPCQPPTKKKPLETKFRFWSNPADWTSGKLPVADEDVEIEPGWNMIYDLAESPIVQVLTINGRLTFSNSVNNPNHPGALNLKAKHVFVRIGELFIGTPEEPHQDEARITLYGEKDSKAMVYDNAIEAGNKLIASVGNITMVGKPRDKMTRLHTPAEKGSSSFKVGTELDWKAGDKIALADTSFKITAGEEREIKSYDILTGDLEVTEPLKYYHWGQSEGTEDDYGKDIRGEVALLSRNIIISG